MTPNEDYQRDLARELTAVGISGRLRRRILDEIADHLACDPEAALGDPQELAHQFADELGSSRARTAALSAFAALVVAGGVVFVSFAGAPDGLLRSIQAAGMTRPVQSPPAIASAAAIVLAVFAQVAFAAGCLAALRWLWRRGAPVLSEAEATVIVRRAAVGVGAGILAMLSLAAIAIAARHQVGVGWSNFTLAAAAAGTVGLAAAAPSLWAAGQVRPVQEGPAGDVLDDLGPLAPARLRGRPWAFAVWFAGGLVVLITLAAVPAADEFDGLARGLLEAAACLGGFAVLGPYLGLWDPGEPGEA